tara:strand:+ start:56932 stop:57870 length:939 start_codon:yes stop_codon:yes gene_type:complete
MSEEKKLTILKEVLGDYYASNNEYLFFCPKCDHHKKKLSVNLVKSAFKCWVCDWSGRNLYRIIRKYGGQQARFNWRSFDQKIEIENFADKLFGTEDVYTPETISLPQGFVSLVNKSLPNTSIRPMNYLSSRFIDKNDIMKWKIGYCAAGKYNGRIVIPSFNLTGHVNYFVTRTYDGSWKKYLNPPVSRDIIFNELYLDFDEELVIVEGVFDAIKAGENSVPLLGSTLNENSYLFHKIVKNDTPVYLALDSDAEKKQDGLIKLFLKYDIEIYKIDIGPHKDVGEMSKEVFLSRKQSATFLSSDNYLLSKIARI